MFNKSNEIEEDGHLQPEELAEKYDDIDYNDEEGLLYVNDEIIIIAEETASLDDIKDLADKYDAEVDDSMSDIGIYRFVFSTSMTYDELISYRKKIKKKDSIEDACISVATEIGYDDSETKKAKYPDDDWNSDDWDLDVPRGENWGMEAIKAPKAWGYLDQMTDVDIGLIDTYPETTHDDLTFDNDDVNYLSVDDKQKVTKYTGKVSPDDHGTHVSGIMCADWDNNEGVSGVMGDKGTLHYASVYNKTDISTSYYYLLAIKTLVDQDVRVINISQNTGREKGFAASHGNSKAIDSLTEMAELTQTGLSRIITSRQLAGKPDFLICVSAGNSNNTPYIKDDNSAYGYRQATSKERANSQGEMGGSEALYNNFLALMSDSDVRDRVIIVGSIGIDDKSTDTETKYHYSEYSCIGSRVDIVAPGDDIYSTVPTSGYREMSGTSMATPHVTGVAGLIFACNPDLTGPEVKNILISTSSRTFYYTDGHSNLLDAEAAVTSALQTKESSVKSVLNNGSHDGLDLCFVVDTTGSMEDDIDNAKENMQEILNHLSEKTDSYRVALVDYRDLSSRTGESGDYACKVQLEFSDNNDEIINAINGLTLGYGGDDPETVYSALMESINLSWREDSKKVIIILGDAPPLDPEPETGYTYDQVILSLNNADVFVDYDNSDERVLNSTEDSLINVYSIGTDASADAADFFEDIAVSTGGSYAGVDDASEVSNAIMDSIDQIEVKNTVTINADFSDCLPESTIDFYEDGDYIFSINTEEDGTVKIEDIEPGDYKWECTSCNMSGSIEVKNKKTITAEAKQSYWFTPIQNKWHQNKGISIFFIISTIGLCVIIPTFISSICIAVMKARRQPRPVRAKTNHVITSANSGNKINQVMLLEKQQEVPVSHSDNDNSLIKRCRYCNAYMPIGDAFCGRCGKSAEEPKIISAPGNVLRTCPQCGMSIGETDKFCGYCGVHFL